MKRWTGIVLASFFVVFAAEAATYRFDSGTGKVERRLERVRGVGIATAKLSVRELSIEKTTVGGREYVAVNADGLPRTNDLGAPRLPFFSMTLAAEPTDLQVSVELGEAVEITEVSPGSALIEPAQEEDCRCTTERKPKFRDHVLQYKTPPTQVRVQALGDFRGRTLTRVTLVPHRYDPVRGMFFFYPNARLSVRSKAPIAEAAELIRAETQGSRGDYLVVVADALTSAVTPWIQHKQAQGFKMRVIEVKAGGHTAATLTQLIQNEYARGSFLYAMFVGSQKLIPAHTVSTSADSKTPSDLPYFTYGGAADIVPDVLAGRIVAETPDQVERVIKKWIDYDLDRHDSSQGWARAVGIASNEGSKPSDNEYVLAIQDAIQKKFGTTFTHLYQNDPNSNPTYFNARLDEGAMWVTYLGHGSGTSWSSFNRTYSVSDMKNMKNARVVKPFWMDVACQNGGLTPGHAGATLMHQASANGEALGTTAFYGGTVNISWHPPAILARGMAFRMVEHAQTPALGSIIQEGHVYLSENTTNKTDLSDNQRWYVLQGDPSMQVRLK